MDLKKQSIILLVVVALAGLVQLGYNKFFNSKSTPEKAALALIEKHLEVDHLIQYVASSDQKVLKEIKSEALKLTKLPNKQITQAQVASSVALSDRAYKIDLQTNEGIVVLNMINQENQWVAFLNLEQNYLVFQLLENLKEAETRENEYDMLAIYRKLNEVVPSEVYEEKIKLLTKFIEDKKEREDYIKNIYVTDLSIKGRVLTGLIQNMGNRKVKVIKANLQLIEDKTGAITEEIPVTLYEVIPGSFVFGQPINPNFQKKFGLNIQTLPQVTDVKKVLINVLSVEFMD